ncbi:MAG: halocarboxylic acid dehydrogenase DehI family protein [Firmicutes bacterium]|nr:halocarboxylic acid dehydrogenase DehI family protein [Bacillota bacterium]
MLDINLVRESNAPDNVRQIYEDIKQSLEIPWTPVMFQIFAAYPEFLEFAWTQLKPSTLTEQFHADSDRARGFAETFVSEMHITSYKHEDALRNNLSINDLLEIRTKLEAFNYGIPKLLLISHALSSSLGGITIGGNGDLALSHNHFGNQFIRKIEINPVEENEASEEITSIYEDIKSTLNTPVVDTIFKTMANWPGFLKLAWDNLVIFMSNPAYDQGVNSLADFAAHAVNLLAYPVKLSRDAMESAGVRRESFEEIEGMIRLFAKMTPGLMLDIVEMQLDVEDLLEIPRGEFAA